MRDLKKEQEHLQTRYRQHIRRVKDYHRLYDKELALLFGFNVDQANLVQKMRNGDAQIHTCDMLTFCQNLISDYGDGSLLQELAPEGFMAYAVKSGMANGTITDEIVQINKYSGLIIKESEKDFPDTQKIINWAKKIAGESGTIEQEMA